MSGAPQDHVDHSDALITCCLHGGQLSHQLGVCVALDENLSPLQLHAIARTLVMLSIEINELAREKAGTN